jgi:hypothetical protein
MAPNNPSPTTITLPNTDLVTFDIGGKIIVVSGEKTSVMKNDSTADEMLACREHAVIEHGEIVVLISIINYSCGTCEKSFAAGFRAREGHCDRNAHTRPSHECDTCPQFFLTENARQAHMTAMNHFLFVCDFCDLAFQDEEHLGDHGRDAHRLKGLPL